MHFNVKLKLPDLSSAYRLRNNRTNAHLSQMEWGEKKKKNSTQLDFLTRTFTSRVHKTSSASVNNPILIFLQSSILMEPAMANGMAKKKKKNKAAFKVTTTL